LCIVLWLCVWGVWVDNKRTKNDMTRCVSQPSSRLPSSLTRREAEKSIVYIAGRYVCTCRRLSVQTEPASERGRLAGTHRREGERERSAERDRDRESTSCGCEGKRNAKLGGVDTARQADRRAGRESAKSVVSPRPALAGSQHAVQACQTATPLPLVHSPIAAQPCPAPV